MENGAIGDVQRLGRRGLLAIATAAAVGAAVKNGPERTEAGLLDAVLMESLNEATDDTAVRMTASGATFSANNFKTSGSSTGLRGTSGALSGSIPGFPTGVYGFTSTGNADATGVFGESQSGIGVRAKSLLGTALQVEGEARFEGGVQATSFAGAGGSLSGLNASSISFGTLSASRVAPLSASKIASGTFASARIPSLDAAKITTGTFNAARIPGLDASKVTAGTLDAARIPGLDAATTTTGVFTTERIPDLDASKVTTGVFAAERIPGLDAGIIVSGTLDSVRIPDLDAAKITTGTLADDRLSADVPRLAAATNAFAGTVVARRLEGGGAARLLEFGGCRRLEFAAGRIAYVVPVIGPPLPASINVVCTLQNSPGRGVALSHVRRKSATALEVRLTARAKTRFAATIFVMGDA